MLRLDRLVRRLGTATWLLLLLVHLLEAQKRCEARIDRHVGAYISVRAGGASARRRANTRAILRAQGNHGGLEDELVANEVVEDDGLPLIRNDVGLFGGELDLFVLVLR